MTLQRTWPLNWALKKERLLSEDKEEQSTCWETEAQCRISNDLVSLGLGSRRADQEWRSEPGDELAQVGCPWPVWQSVNPPLLQGLHGISASSVWKPVEAALGLLNLNLFPDVQHPIHHLSWCWAAPAAPAPSQHCDHEETQLIASVHCAATSGYHILYFHITSCLQDTISCVYMRH